MVKPLDNNVFPSMKDKYYVYGLFKPGDFNPFYIGKGIHGRVNSHFKKSALVKNTPKTAVIKKYGNLIKREILCYFDTEESAYLFEEYLIGLYGLKSEGGYLVNYAKSRYEYSEKFVKDVSSVGYKSRERKYTVTSIVKALRMFYVEKCTSDVISKELNIPERYLYYVLAGEKCKDIYSEFMQKYPDVEKESIETRKTLISHRISKSRLSAKDVSNQDIIRYFDMVCDKQITLIEAAKSLGLDENTLSLIFTGQSRAYLKLDYQRYMSGRKGKFVNNEVLFDEIKTLLLNNMSVNEIVKKTEYGRTTVYRVKTKLLTEKEPK